MALALGANGAITVPLEAQTDARPNVLIILTDDQRQGAYETMPWTIDRLRAEGTEYVNAIATHPHCCPSRASIMSGQYPHNHNVHFSDATQARKLDLANTMQADLRPAGYLTGIAGKYFNGVGSNPPHFDRWAIAPTHDYNNAKFNVNGVMTSNTGYVTTFIRTQTLKMLDFFEQRDSQPWYMYMAPPVPHEPATPQQKYASSPWPPWQDNPANRETDLSDKPPYVLRHQRSLESSQTWRRKMYRTLYSVDEAIKAVFAKLQAQGELEKTLIFYLSDHGFLWHEHGLNFKWVPYNEALRIPFFVRWPGNFPAGAREEKVVGNIDIAPTVYEATGVTPDHVVDGKSLTTSNRTTIFAESYGMKRHEYPIPGWHALWSPSDTYARYFSTSSVNAADHGFREYYAPDDPYQLNNTFADDDPSNDPALDFLLDAQAQCAGDGCL